MKISDIISYSSVSEWMPDLWQVKVAGIALTTVVPLMGWYVVSKKKFRNAQAMPMPNVGTADHPAVVQYKTATKNQYFAAATICFVGTVAFRIFAEYMFYNELEGKRFFL